MFILSTPAGQAARQASWKRMNLAYTRAMVTAAIEGDMETVAYDLDPIFNVYVPQMCPNVPANCP